MDLRPTAPRLRTLVLTSLLAAVPAAALAQDTDGDGVPNASDIFPCDPLASAVSFAPGENAHGTMVFEDLWPIAGDLDFNDVVLRYNYTFHRDATGNVRRVRAVFNVTALGGQLSNGLGLHLPVAGSAVSSITRTIGSGAAQTLTRSGDAELTVSLSNNLRELFGNAAGQINSLSTEPRSTAQVMVVEITFASAVALSTGGAPFDLFVFRTDDSGHQIHRPEFAGTAAMRTALFNTDDDDSSSSRRFVDHAGLPFALVFPSAVSFPREATSISTLFPNIVAFATSAGTTNLDFYTSNVVASAAYADSAGQGAPSPTMPSFPIDTSCVPVTPPPSTYIGSTQTWTVPAGVTSVRIEAWGAEGGRGIGGGVGGRGARVAGTFAVSPGQVLTISVGGRGGNGVTVNAGGGGGGGTFVSRAGTPLLIAGGGGGASYSNTSAFGQPGRIVTAGGLGGYTGQVRAIGSGGYADNGGGGGLGSGGGGWSAAGMANQWVTSGGAAAGGAGAPMFSNYGGYGGWGGGGGSMHGGGGGGGYTGGNGGSYSVGGGGGGSYNAGTSPSATEGVQTGNGAISITAN